MEILKKNNNKKKFRCEVEEGFEIEDMNFEECEEVHIIKTDNKAEIPVVSAPIEEEFEIWEKINNYIYLGLERKTQSIEIYIKTDRGMERFIQCKYLLLLLHPDKLPDVEEAKSIDEIVEIMGYDESLESKAAEELGLSKSEEFWGHKSNLLEFVKEYNTNLLRYNLCWPLLKKLVEAGDPKARRVIGEEIIKRIETRHKSVILYLLIEKYLDFLKGVELGTVIETLEEYSENLINSGVISEVRDAVRILKKLILYGSKNAINIIKKTLTDSILQKKQGVLFILFNKQNLSYFDDVALNTIIEGLKTFARELIDRNIERERVSGTKLLIKISDYGYYKDLFSEIIIPLIMSNDTEIIPPIEIQQQISKMSIENLRLFAKKIGKESSYYKYSIEEILKKREGEISNKWIKVQDDFSPENTYMFFFYDPESKPETILEEEVIFEKLREKINIIKTNKPPIDFSRFILKLSYFIKINKLSSSELEIYFGHVDLRDLTSSWNTEKDFDKINSVFYNYINSKISEIPINKDYDEEREIYWTYAKLRLKENDLIETIKIIMRAFTSQDYWSTEINYDLVKKGWIALEKEDSKSYLFLSKRTKHPDITIFSTSIAKELKKDGRIHGSIGGESEIAVYGVNNLKQYSYYFVNITKYGGRDYGAYFGIFTLQDIKKYCQKTTPDYYGCINNIIKKDQEIMEQFMQTNEDENLHTSLSFYVRIYESTDSIKRVIARLMHEFNISKYIRKR